MKSGETKLIDPRSRWIQSHPTLNPTVAGLPLKNFIHQSRGVVLDLIEQAGICSTLMKSKFMSFLEIGFRGRDRLRLSQSGWKIVAFSASVFLPHSVMLTKTTIDLNWVLQSGLAKLVYLSLSGFWIYKLTRFPFIYRPFAVEGCSSSFIIDYSSTTSTTILNGTQLVRRRTPILDKSHFRLGHFQRIKGRSNPHSFIKYNQLLSLLPYYHLLLIKQQRRWSLLLLLQF